MIETKDQKPTRGGPVHFAATGWRIVAATNPRRTPMTAAYAKFDGIHGEKVTVHRSTESGDPRVWLVANRGGDNNGALHLTPEQCPKVIKALEAFIADAEKLRLDAKRAQTWQAGDPEPERVLVRDRDGCVWYPFGGGWRHALMSPYAAVGWAELLERHGPVCWHDEKP